MAAKKRAVNSDEIRPVLIGANGSGKSTLTKLSSVNFLLIDPDAIAREIDPVNPASASIAAGRQALVLCQQYAESGRSFMVETTLAGKSYLNLMSEMKSRGWSVFLMYIGIDNPNLNVKRVRDRVELGGHDVPRTDILRRYERSLANLSKAAKIAYRLDLYDNSTNAGYQLIATVEGDRSIVYVRELPGWIDRANLNIRSNLEA
jgi:predicted ABC-type ATPase